VYGPSWIKRVIAAGYKIAAYKVDVL